ncbi:hypothetical protein [Mesoplasma melaleucae]|uniref:hypothetical protein n=1 Tax=Mesoplasma melaleucae TaxID=81459 RepID=UPI0004834E42|nr:hypothetical protein [Mesoplasma melaleucae]
MFKIIIMIFSLFTNAFFFENNHLNSQFNSVIENKSVEYPNKEYSVNISNSQNINNQVHLWKGNYNYNFSINLKDFNNYSFYYFSFKIEFELLEQIIDKNDIAITNKN